MGRYYKSARPQNIDYGFEFPLQALAVATNRKDKQIDETYNQLEVVEASLNDQRNRASSGVGKTLYTPLDEEAYNTEIGRFESDIDRISNTINENPLQAQSSMKDIRKLRTDVGQSFRTGILHNINKNAGVLDTWIKANKSKDPVMVNKVLEAEMEKWGGTVGKNGNFNTLSLPTVYDLNTGTEALKSAKSISKTIPESERLQHTTDLMLGNGELVKSISQQLDYGMLKNEEGIAIDPTNLTTEEREALILGEIQNKAADAVKMTRSVKSKTKGSGKTKEADKTFEGVKSTTDSLPVKTTMGYVEDLRRQPDGTMLSSFDATKLAIVNNIKAMENSTDASSMINTSIENMILKQELSKAQQYAANNKFVDPLNGEASQEELIQDYFDKEVKKKTTPIGTDAWPEHIKVGDKNLAAKQLKSIPESQLNKYTMYTADNPELNGKSVDQLKEAGTIGFTEEKSVKADRDAFETKFETPSNKANFELGKPTIVTNTDKSKVYRYPITTLTEDGANSTFIQENAESDGKGGYYHDIPITYNKTNNFSLSTDQASPSRIMAEDGSSRIRLEATYKGEKIPIYMSTSQLKIPAIEKAMNFRQPSSDPKSINLTQKEKDMGRMQLRKAKFAFDPDTRVEMLPGMFLEKNTDGDMVLEMIDPTTKESHVYKNELEIALALSAAMVK